MEAAALQASAGLARTRIGVPAPLLRLRSDEQLVALFRAGNDEAFRVIHDRYRRRLLAYTRQMLPGSGHDAEDALQDIFVRAYCGLRSNDRELALRAWLYRVAHNRCIDELRRPPPPLPEPVDMDLIHSQVHDPVVEAEQRESISRLIVDVRRLPEQQRSALLMRELGGMAYADVAGALAVSVPAVKSLLVRARLGLTQALEARDTACAEIHEELILAHDRGVRPNAVARRHMRDCAGCREFRVEVRAVSRRFAALVPALGPLGVLTKLLGFGGGAAAGGGGAAAGGAAGTGTVASMGVLAAGTSHVAGAIAAAVVAAGGVVGIQHAIVPPVHRAQYSAGHPAAIQPSAPAWATPATHVPGDASYGIGSAKPPGGSSSPATNSAVALTGHAAPESPPPPAPSNGSAPPPGQATPAPGPAIPETPAAGQPVPAITAGSPASGSTPTDPTSTSGNGSIVGAVAGEIETVVAPAGGAASGSSSNSGATTGAGSGQTPGTGSRAGSSSPSPSSAHATAAGSESSASRGAGGASHPTS